MLYKIIPCMNECPPYAFWDDFLTREQLDMLQIRAQQSTLDASIGGENGFKVDVGYRRTKINWLPFSPDTGWVFERIGDIVSKLNSRFYRFDIDGFGEQIQLSNYNSNEAGTYDWHIDSGALGEKVRKMSVVVQLSEPGEYEGGELQILHTSDRPLTIEKKRGRLIMFPSYTIHKVTPVTAGSRQTLVAWLFGNPLR
jgi:PKHD-type hydroxylase